MRLVGRVVREEGRRLCGERPSPVSTPFPCSEPSGPALWSESAWSQAFLVGVSCLESGLLGRSQLGASAFRAERATPVGVSAELALSRRSGPLRSESAWSQRFSVGVSVESALSHWSQPLQLESAWSQQLRLLHAGASWSGMESADPARSGLLRLAPPRSERSCVGAGVGLLVMWALYNFALCVGQNASHNTQILACFPDQLDLAPFLKTQSSVIKRPAFNETIPVAAARWLPSSARCTHARPSLRNHDPLPTAHTLTISISLPAGSLQRAATNEKNFGDEENSLTSKNTQECFLAHTIIIISTSY